MLFTTLCTGWILKKRTIKLVFAQKCQKSKIGKKSRLIPPLKGPIGPFKGPSPLSAYAGPYVFTLGSRFPRPLGSLGCWAFRFRLRSVLVRWLRSFSVRWPFKGAPPWRSFSVKGPLKGNHHGSKTPPLLGGDPKFPARGSAHASTG